MTRALLAFLVVSGLVVGAWAELDPRGFHGSFPGFGREWLPPLGPFNEHLVRDVGALNLALAALAGFALARPARDLVRATGIAWSVWGVLHLAYHATMLEMFGTLDNVLMIGSLGLVALVAAGLVLRPMPA